jgi:GrpB-like predicted nucleotidyltransferase (UPF0157 family)
MVSFVSGPGSRVEGAPKELVVLSEHDPAWLEIGAELVAGLRALLGDHALAVELKRELAVAYPEDRPAYTEGKTGFITAI